MHYGVDVHAKGFRCSGGALEKSSRVAGTGTVGCMGVYMRTERRESRMWHGNREEKEGDVLRVITKRRCVCVTFTGRRCCRDSAVLRATGKWLKMGYPGLRDGCRGTRSLLTRHFEESSLRPALQGTGVPGARQARNGAKGSTKCANTGLVYLDGPCDTDLNKGNR